MQQKYEVQGVIGEGAYGIVYKCKNKETNEYVAIKKFKETEEPIVKKTMKRELRVLQIMKHENVVEFKEAFQRKGNLYLVFEFVERNLLELLQENQNGLQPHLIKKLIYQLCKAIKYLHEQNIIHRDIKPENLLVNNDNQLKLCDFGFARKITKSNESLTDYVATRWYRSPELLITNGYYGTEIDYWAIGCIMGELVDGNPLFPGENETDQLHYIQKVLGNLPEEQVNMFYNNPLYNGKNLLNVTKPEKLERRYLGKLPKVAIEFMKGLLELDPKKRLNGTTVFTHPYFEEYVNKEREMNMAMGNINANVIARAGGNNSISQRTTRAEQQGQGQAQGQNQNQSQSQAHSQSQIQNSQAEATPTINTTNINIINYNNYNNPNTPSNPEAYSKPIDLPSNISFTQLNKLQEKDTSKPERQPDKSPSKQVQILKQYNTSTKLIPQQKSIASTGAGLNSSSQDLTNYTTALNFNKNGMNDNLGGFASLPGYKTFYSNNKHDKYNYGINTKFQSNTIMANNNISNYGNSLMVNGKPYQMQVSSTRNPNEVIEEEVEYKNFEDMKRKKKINPLLKANSNIKQLNMLYYGNGQKYHKGGTSNNINYMANCSSYGPSFGRMKKIELPSLGKLGGVSGMNNQIKKKKGFYV